MGRVLLLDCYLDELGCARHFLPALGAATETHRCAHAPFPEDAAGADAIVVTGSAASALDDTPWIARLGALLADAAAREVPVLGVCFGHQVAALALRGPGAVRRSPTPELGWFDVEVVAADPLLDALPRTFRTFCSHFDDVAPDTPGLEVLARSPRCPVQAYRLADAPVWGVQFHAEMDAEETERLLRERSAEHHELGIDVDAALTGRADTAALRDRLLAEFLRAAGLDRGNTH